MVLTAERHPVFVYGSLKAGEANHHWLAGAVGLGRRLLIGARLHDLGPYPMALLEPGSSRVIHGELYGVNTAGLARLDELEDVPHEYERSLCRLSDGQQAWVYHGRPEQVRDAPTLPLGSWGALPVLHYGSNLNPRRLRQRCPGWDGQGLVVRLEGWRWALDKRGRSDGTGCAGITPCSLSHVWGVVTHLRPEDRQALDGHEGVASGHYHQTLVTVSSRCGASFEASTYVPAAAHRQGDLKASPAYASHILAGLKAWALPPDWRHRLATALAVHAEADR